MAAPNTNIEQLYKFTLQQVAAESYFEGLDLTTADLEVLKERLRLGTNRPGYRNGPSGLNEGYPGYTRMTKSQAEEFLSTNKVIHQWSDNPSTGNPAGSRPAVEGIDSKPQLNDEILANTGLSATLIQARNTDGVLTNQYTLAIRSTEFRNWVDGGDGERDKGGADIGSIAFNGFALAQLDALEQYYQWLKNNGKLPADSTLNVTGYSLGGHLATVFTEIHQNDKDISFGETVTFNGAGRGTWNTAVGTEADMLAYYRQVLNNPDFAPSPGGGIANSLREAARGRMGEVFDPKNIYEDPRYTWALEATRSKFGLTLQSLSNIDSTGTLADDRITQVFGYETANNINFTANAGIHGPAVAVGIESQPLIEGNPFGSGDFGNAHSISLIADSLALQRALRQLDSTYTLDGFVALLPSVSYRKPISGANANYEFDVLENILDPLRKFFLGDAIAATSYKEGASGFGDIASRTTFHDNLTVLQNNDTFKALIGKVQIVAPGTRALDARSDFGQLLAFNSLAPFALKVSGDALVALKTANRALADAWEADLALTFTERELGLGNFSDTWLADRAAMLERKQWFGTQNKNPVNPEQTASPNNHPFENLGKYFEDAASGYKIQQGALVASTQRVLFGGKVDEIIKGDAAADHLYGGGGEDTLEGNAGDDYIEGNADNDTLIGGKGADTLVGGMGEDTYQINTGDGDDIIIDQDGKGSIKINGGAALEGGDYVSPGIWKKGSVTYEFTPVTGSRGDLKITTSVGTTTVKNFAPGDLGIVLPGAPVVSADRTIVGDLQPIDIDPVTPGVQFDYDDLNNYRTNGAAPGYNDFLNDSPGDDRLQGKGGSDILNAQRGGNDILETGSGSDIAGGGTGNDELFFDLQQSREAALAELATASSLSGL